MQKIAICGCVGIPAKYGGFETLCENLVANSSTDSKIQFIVFCSSKAYKERPKFLYGAELIYIPLNANGFYSILYDAISLFIAIYKGVDTILLLGVSGSIAIPFLRLLSTKVKIVTNIDGIEWRRDKWNYFTKAFLKISERIAVKFSNQIIVDNKGIYDYVLEEYGIVSNMIEYGGDNAKKIPLREDILCQFPFLKKPYACTVCRIEPENNIHIILETFQQIDKIPLVIVGNWANSNYGQYLKKQYSGNQNIHLLDPIYDHEKINMIRSNCLLYIHGHSAGGTNPSLVEAMSLALPIFAFDVIFNRETTENMALFFDSSASLKKLIISSNSSQLEELGKTMKKIAERRYKWTDICNKYYLILE